MAKKAAKTTEPEPATAEPQDMTEATEAMASELIEQGGFTEPGVEVPSGVASHDDAKPEKEPSPAPVEQEESVAAEETETQEEADEASLADEFSQLPEDLQRAALKAIQRKADDATDATEDVRASDEPRDSTAQAGPSEAELAQQALQAERDELESNIAELEEEFGETLSKPLRSVLDKTFERAARTEEIARAALALNDAQAAEMTATGKRVQKSEAKQEHPDVTPEQMKMVERMVDKGVVEVAEGGNPYSKAIGELRAIGAISKPMADPGRPRATDEQREMASTRSAGISATEVHPDMEDLDAESIQEAIERGDPMFAGLRTEG